LSERMGRRVTSKHHAKVMDEMARLIPSYGGIDYDRLREECGLVWPCPTKKHPGTPVLHANEFTHGKGKFHFPVSLAVDRRGRFHVLDSHRGEVLVFSAQGERQGGYAREGWLEGRLHYPTFIFADDEDRMFVVDQQNGRVSVFK